MKRACLRRSNFLGVATILCLVLCTSFKLTILFRDFELIRFVELNEFIFFFCKLAFILLMRFAFNIKFQIYFLFWC